MNVSILKITDKKYLIQICGEIDESNADYLRRSLDELIDLKDNIELILDFEKLDFMDSTGIGVILGRYKKCKNKNIEIYIKNPSKHVDLILNTCGIYTVIRKIC